MSDWHYRNRVFFKKKIRIFFLHDSGQQYMLKTKLGRTNILIYQEIVVKENGAVGVGVDELEQELLRIKLP